MNFLYSLCAFLAAITLLVFIHEYGHFKVARLCGIKVKRFSIGLGKPFFTLVDRHGTEWALAPIPMGGYISMVDTRVEDPAPEELDMAFDKKSLWRRSAVVIAGPLSNLVFAWAVWATMLSGSSQELAPYLGAVVSMSLADEAGFEEFDKIISIDGSPTLTLVDARLALMRNAMSAQDSSVVVERGGSRSTLTLATSKTHSADIASSQALRALGFSNPVGALAPAKVKSIVPGGPFALAGVAAGDTVVAIDGKAVTTWSSMGALASVSADKPLAFTLLSPAGATRVASVTPKIPSGAKDGVAKVGAALDIENLSEAVRKEMFVSVDRGALVAMKEAAMRCVHFTQMTWDALASIMSGRSGTDGLSGPVGIAKQAGIAAHSGAEGFGNFLAFLSLSLFFMNLLPLPGLDGGHLAMFAVEAVTRRPLSERIQNLVTRLGFSLLAALMVFALFSDIIKLAR